ncbi:MAG: hypothetical protein ACE5KU_00035 [Nitrososphaerales archaeon]
MDTSTPIRPAGATILAIFILIGAVIALMVGVFAFAVSGFVSDFLTESGILEEYFMLPGAVITPSFIGTIIALIGVVSTIIGLINILLAYGLLKGTDWARLIAMVFAALGVFLSLVSLASGNMPSLVGLLVNGAIIYYLTRPHVAKYYRTPK